jgi:aminoglycoside phosphotransferase (APT) family kinase protein
VVPSGEWFVLDWDDLGLGDPVLDVAVLLWPRLRAAPDAWRAYPVPGRGAPALAARMGLHLRALLLDEVVDSLADWVEAATIPEHLEAVRPVKRRVHERALALCRERYGA